MIIRWFRPTSKRKYNSDHLPIRIGRAVPYTFAVSRRQLLVLLAILALAAFLRLWRLETVPRVCMQTRR